MIHAVKLQKRSNRTLYTRAMYDRPYDNENSFGATYGEHREFLDGDGLIEHGLGGFLVRSGDHVVLTIGSGGARGATSQWSQALLAGREAGGKVSSISGATGAKFALIPPDNATGNFTKVVQRVPVRVELEPKEVAEHPLRVGLSMMADVDTHEVDAAKAAALTAPAAAAAGYDSAEKQAQADVAALLDRLLSKGHGGVRGKAR